MPTWQDGESAHALVAARLGVDDRLPACTPWDWRGARRSRHDGRSDRVVRAGEPVVVDIGGPAPSGHFSDSTLCNRSGRDWRLPA